jgi:hypothetical protein
LELNEAVHRMFGSHQKPIVAFMLLGAAFNAALHDGDTPQYAATSRFVLEAGDPGSQAA